VKSDRSAPPDATLLQLAGWVLRRAARRWLPLSGVALTLLVKVALDALKPWPTLILVDYALLKKPLPESWLELARHVPGALTPSGLIGWSIASTVLLFLLGWIAGLANAYAGITLGQRMTYD
jgi:hypothetical protein